MVVGLQPPVPSSVAPVVSGVSEEAVPVEYPIEEKLLAKTCTPAMPYAAHSSQLIHRIPFSCLNERMNDTHDTHTTHTTHTQSRESWPSA